MTVAVLIAPMFEDSELIYPYYRLKEAGYDVVLIGPDARSYTGKNGVTMTADRAAPDVDPSTLDGVVIPGGYSPDHMRRSPEMVDLVRKVAGAGKPVAAICHAGWMLASARLVEGRKVTSYHSIRDDMEHAGATWVDEEVVIDQNLITSRSPADLPAFMRAVIEALGS